MTPQYILRLNPQCTLIPIPTSLDEGPHQSHIPSTVSTAFVARGIPRRLSRSEVGDGVCGHVADELAVGAVDPSDPVADLFGKRDHGEARSRPVLVLDIDHL